MDAGWGGVCDTADADGEGAEREGDSVVVLTAKGVSLADLSPGRLVEDEEETVLLDEAFDEDDVGGGEPPGADPCIRFLSSEIKFCNPVTTFHKKRFIPESDVMLSHQLVSLNILSTFLT